MYEPRPRLIVLWNFQKWFLIRFVLSVGFFLVCFGLGLYLWYQMLLQEVLAAFETVPAELSLALQEQMSFGTWIMIGFCLILVSIASIQSLMLSRHVAGPIFAMTHHLEKCENEKKYSPLKLREGDLFKDFVEKLNRLMERVNH